MDAQPAPEELLPLSPAVFHILLALANGERHGYGIMREIAAATDGQMHIGPVPSIARSGRCSMRA